MKKTSVRCSVAALVCVLAQASHAQNIAVVNGQRIPKARADYILKALQEQFKKSNKPVPPNLEANIKNKLIENAVMVQAAQEKKLHLTEEYAIQMEQERERVLSQMLFENFKKEHGPSDEAARKEYDKLVASYPGQEYLARHILVKSEADAQKVLRELKAGGNFEALAKRYSQDPGSAQRGGELGWSPDSGYVAEFGAALRGLKKGDTTAQPVKTQFGYHIIRLEDVRKAQVPPFETVKEDIKNQMQGSVMDEFKKYLDGLKSKAKVQ